MGTYGTVGASLSYLSRYFDVNCVFYVPNKAKLLRKDVWNELLSAPNINVVEHGRTYEDCVEESRRIAREKGWYNANPGLENNMMNMYAFSYLAKELHKQIDGKIDCIFCQTSNGSSISGLHMGFKQLWVDEDVNYLPRLWAVSTDQGNAIIESFKKGDEELITLEPGELRETRYNRNLINWTCYSGQDALNALNDTGGGAIGVTDEKMLEYYLRFKKLEKIKLSRSNSFPIAAFFKACEEGRISSGTHIIVLNDGRINLEIKRLGKSELPLPYPDFLAKLKEWLIQFKDPLDEIEEAVENAFECGFVLGAFDSGVLVGITIVSTSQYETFFPKYHLSYIATKKDVKGRGIATQLIQKVIELTKGDFSLHVERDNARAIKLYEKMGLKRKYFRMLYQGEVPES